MKKQITLYTHIDSENPELTRSRTVILSGLKKEIERMADGFSRLNKIRSYQKELRGIIGKDETSSIYFIVFGQSKLADEEAFENDFSEFVKDLPEEISLDCFRELAPKIDNIFSTHIPVKDNRQTEEQHQQEMTARNELIAQHERNRVIEAAKKANSRAKLIEEYPYLQKTSNLEKSRITATKNIRTELSRLFPGFAFSITSKSFSGGNDINVRWTDGPTYEEVHKIVSKYEYGSFNGMSDCYEMNQDSSFTDLFGGVKYAFSDRDISIETRHKVAEKFGVNWDDKLCRENNEMFRTIQEAISETSFYVKPEVSSAEVSQSSFSSSGIVVRHNTIQSGVEIVFPSKPSQDVIDSLKANGFRWSFRTKVWYCKYSDYKMQLAKKLVGLTDDKPEVSQPDYGVDPAEAVTDFEYNLQVESNQEQGMYSL